MKEWSVMLNYVFDNSIPKYTVWDDNNSIIKVLSKIGSELNSNHMFYPDGGGMDLKGASISNETGCIEIDTGFSEVLKPSKLSFHRMADVNQSYFRLELDELSLLYRGSNTEFIEAVCEIIPGNYIEYKYIDEGQYQGESLPCSARPINRILKGSIVIFGKDSIYNRTSGTYDGRHNKYDEEQFFDYINRSLSRKK